MGSTFSARAPPVANTRAPSSDSLYSVSTVQSEPRGTQHSNDRSQHQVPETRAPGPAFQLLRDLRAPETQELVNVYYSRNRHERPLVIPRCLLMRTSSVFSAMLCCHGLLPDPNTLHLDTDFSVLVVFVFWMYRRRVPESEDIDGQHRESMHQEDRGVYQIMLARSWVFAEDWGVPELQNAIMETLFRTFAEATIDADVLGTCLQISQEGSAMRIALIEYMLWSDDVQEQFSLYEDSGRLLADLVDVRDVDGFEADFALAAEAFEREGRELERSAEMNADAMQTYAVGMPAGRERPRAEMYFV